MRLPTVCFRHVQVLSGCYFMHPSAFFPVYDVFFRLFLHVLVLPSSSSLCKISFGGSAMCGSFTNTILLLFRFFLSPPSCGGAVGGVPSGGDLHPTDKSSWSYCHVFIFLTTLFCAVLSLSLFGTLDACAKLIVIIHQSLPLASV